MDDTIASSHTDKSALLDNVIIALLISALIFIVCPAFIVSSNLADIIVFPLAGSAKVSLIAFIVSFLGFLALMQIKILRPAFLALLVFVALSALILPVTSSVAMVDPSSQPVNVVNLILCLVIAMGIGIAATKFEIIRKISINMIAFVSVLTLGLSVFSISKSIDTAVSPEEVQHNTFSELSSKRNIIVMSFDGVPGEMITRVLRDDATFKSKLEGFTYFPNTYSQSPATEASGFGELYGVQNYKKLAKTIKELRENIKTTPAYKNSYLNRVENFEQLYSAMSGRQDTRANIKFSEAEQHSNVFLIQNSFSRIFTKYFFKTGIPSVVEKLLLTQDAGSRFATESQHNGEKWDFKNVKKIGEYDDFVSSLTTEDTSSLAVRYYHNTFSHFPIDFDENCVHRSVDKDWFDSNQNEAALQNQTKCVAKKILNLVDKLKEIGAYDNSTIVFKSDHGEPFYYFDEPPNNLSFNKDTKYGYNRYRPFLMIKKSDHDQSELTYDNRLVLLNDLAKTLCKDSRVKKINCNTHKGIDLLSTDAGLDTPYFLYILKNRKATYQYDTHISIKIPNREIDPLEFLMQSPKVDVGIYKGN